MNEFKKILSKVNTAILKNSHELEKKKIGSGGNGVCYRAFNHVVVASSAYTSRDLKILKDISQKCKEKGTNIIPIIDFQIIKDRKQFNICLILQPFCNGIPLYRNFNYYLSSEDWDNESINSVYLKHLNKHFFKHFEDTKRIAFLEDKQLKKFIVDYLTISKEGIEIDNLNTENFLINENGINFIDLGLRHNSSHPSLFELSQEIIGLLIGYDYDYIFDQMFTKEKTDKLNNLKKIILSKTLKTMDELGVPHPAKNELSRSIYIYPKQPNVTSESTAKIKESLYI